MGTFVREEASEMYLLRRQRRYRRASFGVASPACTAYGSLPATCRSRAITGRAGRRQLCRLMHDEGRR